ncbi:LysM peptidoglycan-binding domain-containing protein [Salinarimonas ramus]|uniref:LysM domain-containing protein n=1 Tax=Salinarimonas ramus TaxID=690164 RepID=A0A917Q867_9HYPH|nr:LysM peptidoglycan-binding domain-containing protein [Salinarimonas ramus]GGK33590.1 hypothetical protein GCM10011322_20300 [Salinarimonas ramus]
MLRLKAQPNRSRKRGDAEIACASMFEDDASAADGTAAPPVPLPGMPRAIALAVLSALLVALATQAAPRAIAQEAACAAERVVAIGDTLTNVAQRCGITPQALLEANPQISDPNILPLGTTIAIPGGSAAPSPTQAAPVPGASGSGVAPVRILPAGNPLDPRVRVFARGLPPGASVLVGAGPGPAAALYFHRAQVDATGVLSEVLVLPDWAIGPSPVHVVVEAPIGGPILRAEPWTAPAVRP